MFRQWDHAQRIGFLFRRSFNSLVEEREARMENTGVRIGQFHDDDDPGGSVCVTLLAPLNVFRCAFSWDITKRSDFEYSGELIRTEKSRGVGRPSRKLRATDKSSLVFSPDCGSHFSRCEVRINTFWVAFSRLVSDVI